MTRLIGIWTAAEMLVDAARSGFGESQGLVGQSEPMLAAFRFLQIAASEGRCVVKGRQGRNGMLAPIPTDDWASLTIDPIAANSDDDAEYSEAQAHPFKAGSDYNKNVWNDLRWGREEIDALGPFFKDWYDAKATTQIQSTPMPNSPQTEATDRPPSLNQYAARLFAEPFWPVQRVLRWIAFRDPAHLESSLRAGRMYSSPPLKERSPETVLLRALQYDDVHAIQDGKELRRETWAAADGRKWPDVHFRREDVLAMWPDPQSAAAAHLNFGEIAGRWSKLTGEPTDKMLDALVQGFWRGVFEDNGDSRVFNLLLPNGSETGGEYAYSRAHKRDGCRLLSIGRAHPRLGQAASDRSNRPRSNKGNPGLSRPHR